MCPLRLLDPALTRIYVSTEETTTLAAEVSDFGSFAVWLSGAALVLLLGKQVGSAQKKLVNYLLDLATPEEIPVRIPQTGRI
ncbi:hypothetical protein ACFLXC_04100 [Chloroflexota bacterium]